jgi:hypothetical protein
MKLTYVPKVELTEEEKNALRLAERILYEVCSDSECYNCILKDFCGDKGFDPMETPEQINEILIGES